MFVKYRIVVKPAQTGLHTVKGQFYTRAVRARDIGQYDCPEPRLYYTTQHIFLQILRETENTEEGVT